MRFTNRSEANQFYADILSDAEKENSVSLVMRDLGKNDLFFLLCKLLNRKDVDKDFLFNRCVEVQNEPDGYLDLWAREHYKSTIITFAKTIQDILINPEETVGIFSHTRPIAKKFLWQIKTELETNELLKEVYSDVLWSNPHKESPLWSLDSGIVIKRKNNPKEATVEAWGLVDGQPTSKHFSILVYDDVVTLESVTNPEMINKVTDRWAVSLNLGAADGRRRTIGTRYHLFDTYEEMMKREAVIPRIYPATDNGKHEGNPVFLTRKKLDQKRKEMGPYVYAAQMMQNPTAEEAQGFSLSWIQNYTASNLKLRDLNLYLICDPASEKKKDSDYTVQLVIGTGPDNSYYLVDGVRDRMNLTERTKRLIGFHRKYGIKKPVGYEKYGKDSDIEHIKYVQDQENYRFNIVELGGRMAKNDRIRRIVPDFENGRFFIPHILIYEDVRGAKHDLIKQFIEEEYYPFPVCKHDDVLDCMSRIKDEEMAVEFPMPQDRRDWMFGKNNVADQWNPHDYLQM